MRTTEQESLYQNLENQTVFDLLTQMNQEDFKVPKAVSSSIPQINVLIDNILPRMKRWSIVLFRCRYEWTTGYS